MNQAFKTFLLALEVKPMSVGTSYDQLPMHCTIMHRFHSMLDAAALTAELQPTLAVASPIELLPLNHQAFGPKKQLVTIVEPTPALRALHQQLYHKLNALGVQHTESDWVDDGYTPHITDKQGRRLAASTPTVSDAVYLISVEHPLKGSRRFIEARIALAEKLETQFGPL